LATSKYEASAVKLRQAASETTVTYSTGIDVSLEVSHFCIVDTAGSIVKATRVASGPEAIIS